MTSDNPRAVAGTELRVLMVEDSPEDAEVVLDELRDGGYAVEYARVETMDALRAALTTGHWQLVLCDYRLPTFDALRVLAVVRELRLDVPVIVVSGAVGEEAVTALVKAGAHDFLLKNHLSRLVMAVERELRDAAVRAERTALEEQLLLSDRLVQIGTLAAGVAHEINNPLTYVIGNIEYALSELSSPVCARKVPASVLDALKAALEGSARIRTTTEDLRVFSRTGDARPHPVRLKRVLESAVGMALTQMRYRAKLVQHLEEVPLIAACENRLGQVFLNLLINAAQSIPEGNPDDHEICLRLRRVGSSVQVDVSDTGVGIVREVRERLFQPFVTTKPRDTGTGLGLSICRKIVTEYGGEICAWANPDRGTTFRVTLPIREVDSLRTAPTGANDPASRRGRVLVLDDEPEIVALICRELCPEHDALGATSVAEALKLMARDSAFDVILCDLMMPGADGIQFYELLEQRAPEFLERIVFMTGGPFTPAARQFLSATHHVCIRKPFEPTVLSMTVRETIARASRVQAAIDTAI